MTDTRSTASTPSMIRGLTLLGTVALVVGNMVGTSVYTLAASLAETTGPLGLLAWGLTAFGYLFVALVYASLGTRYPVTGGPYVFVQEAFGEFAGFLTMWAYWLSAVIGNAAIATGVVGYAVGFSPRLEASVPLQFVLGQGLLWGLCLLNVLGVRQSARLQITVMALSAVPMLLISVGLLAHFDAANLTPFAPHGWGTLAAGAALVVWAYSGVESATVPAEEVDRPERTIARGTMIGYALATLLFLAGAAGVAGALPNDVVASSARPMSMAAERTLGPAAGWLIGVAAVVAGVGTLNGWILMAGRIPVTAARQGIFFSRLAAIHPRWGTPHVGLVVGTIVPSALLLMYFSGPLLGVFNFVVLLSVLTTLLPHLGAAAAEWRLSRRYPERYTPRARLKAALVAPPAVGFLLFCIYGVGLEVALWGVVSCSLGVPLYLFFARRRERADVLAVDAPRVELGT